MIRGVWNQVSQTIGMASPLSQAGEATINSNTPPNTLRHDDYEVTRYTTHTSAESDSEGPPSSPFVSNVSDSTDAENISPSRWSRLAAKSPIEREHPSPLKILQSRTSPAPKPQSPQKE